MTKPALKAWCVFLLIAWCAGELISLLNEWPLWVETLTSVLAGLALGFSPLLDVLKEWFQRQATNDPRDRERL